MIWMKRLRSVVWFLLLLVLCTGTALAKTSPGDKKEAAKLDKQADALVKKGEREQAIDKLREADSLDPTPSRKVHLAKVLMDLARLLEAAQALEQASETKAADRKERASVEKAKKLLAEVKQRTPTLLVKIIKPEASTVKVEVDGKGFDPSAGPQPLDPGYHQLSAQATGYDPFKKEVSLAERANESVEISLKKPGEAEGAAATDEGSSSGGGFSKAPAVVFWCLGAVGLGFGIGYGVVAIQDTNQLRDDYGCQEDRCPAAAQDDLDAAKLKGNISTVGFVVAGVGLATGTILWLVSGSGDDESPPADDGGSASPNGESSRIRLKPMVGLGAVGLSGTF